MLMKKLFTLLAMIFCVGVVHAQRITFDVPDASNPAKQESYSAGDFKLTYVDTEGKQSVATNNTYTVSYTHLTLPKILRV